MTALSWRGIPVCIIMTALSWHVSFMIWSGTRAYFSVEETLSRPLERSALVLSDLDTILRTTLCQHNFVHQYLYISIKVERLQAHTKQSVKDLTSTTDLNSSRWGLRWRQPSDLRWRILKTARSALRIKNGSLIVNGWNRSYLGSTKILQSRECTRNVLCL